MFRMSLWNTTSGDHSFFLYIYVHRGLRNWWWLVDGTNIGTWGYNNFYGSGATTYSIATAVSSWNMNMSWTASNSYVSKVVCQTWPKGKRTKMALDSLVSAHFIF